MGFLYDDISSKSMGLKARLTSWQVCGGMRNFTTTVPGKYGVTDFGADFDYREINVACNIYPKHSFSALVSTLDELSTWLDPMQGLKELVFDDVPDRYFMARLNEKVDCERLIRFSGSFNLKFFCPDPFAYAITDENYLIESEGSHTITRQTGNVASNPMYRLKGIITSGVNNSISVTTNGLEMKIVNAVLLKEEILVIDTDKMTAYVEDENGIILRNALPYLKEIQFPSLHVGTNILAITTNNAVFTALEIKARSRWR
ncbi:distal tail protein Dit [Enterococcus lemanii]|uniref:Distal tail protein Dit n=1 Tax=Enterococcus lemanii TaxID=1159752 RepID=A0ABV9N094_9ENTE|nr:distal tail protein Dit [Enterococcus lemanii]MBM7707858.1 putative phage tail component-like protein [Enterococcus lemanii]